MRQLHNISRQKELTDRQKAHLWYAKYMLSKKAYINPDGSVSYIHKDDATLILNWYNDPRNDRAVIKMWEEARRPEPKIAYENIT